MALALNIFKTITNIVPPQMVGIYTAPVGYTGVVLLAQCANISQTTETVSLSLTRIARRTGIAVTTEMLQEFPISGNDTANLLAGKLVVESGDILKISGSSSNSNLKFLASILETLN
jgi:hypothetical protein